MGGMYKRIVLGASAAGALAALAGLANYAIAWGEPPADQPKAQQPPSQTDQPSADDIRRMMERRGGGGGDDNAGKDDFKPFAEVSKDYTQVVSTADGQPSLFNIWTRERDGQMLAELPRGWQSQKYLLATTTPTGELFAGLQAGEVYFYIKRYDKRIAFIMPNTEVRSTGDRESKDSIQNHFTDRVLVDVPIECMGPGGQPVIDLDGLFVGQANLFYGGLAAGANPRLATISKAKAFPKNIEAAFTVPVAGGQIKRFHYSVSLLEENPGYQPRVADERVGYFQTTFRDLGKFRDDQVDTRYINRWHLEKADPKLKMSPPKEPLIYYVEHTVPVRYRRWVKDGTLYWNKAFEAVGIRDAVEVYYQDKSTGAHMDKDPEDVRYNFIRWLSNDIGTAIGPSRAHPITGQILDADIVLTDGWIRHFWYQSNELLPQTAMEGMNAETLAWLDERPQWDPRVRLAPPEKRAQVLAQRQAEAARRGIYGYGSSPLDFTVLANPELQRLSQFVNTRGGLCMMSDGMARDMAIAGLYLETAGLLDLDEMAQPGDRPPRGERGDKDDKGEKKDDKPKEDTLDGIPEWFVGPALAHLTVHEVGHTLGLRHNFKSSSIYSLSEINSEGMKGKATVGSVMDYTPVNINMDDKAVQGDYHMIGVGPYDMWAIEYGYGSGDLKEVLKKVSDPKNTYATDEDTGGPDPLARRYDFAKDPLDYAKAQMALANFSRGKILDKFVKDGEPWVKARRGYEITLSTQMAAVNIMANWIGGVDVVRDRKGDPGNRQPITPISAEAQRAALKFCIDNSFPDQAFGLTPELLNRMTINKDETPDAEPTWPIHDRISGIQASVMTMVMNPTKLRRVYDAELYSTADKDVFTLPEMLDTISKAVWSELDNAGGSKFSARQPMISSLRRNLQREYIDRMIDLTLQTGTSPSTRSIAALASAKLTELVGKVDNAIKSGDGSMDPYTKSHLGEIKQRVAKVLDAQYIYNPSTTVISQPAGRARPFGAEQSEVQQQFNPDHAQR
ncbi:MAG: zinc-dependent metalloprotease [Phycisphaerales bacterium]|nr:zinc-dependent metalloprotease [Phycisphaerales bacterium]